MVSTRFELNGFTFLYPCLESWFPGGHFFFELVLDQTECCFKDGSNFPLVHLHCVPVGADSSTTSQKNDSNNSIIWTLVWTMNWLNIVSFPNCWLLKPILTSPSSGGGLRIIVQLPGKIATGLMALARQTGLGKIPLFLWENPGGPLNKPEKTIAADSFLFEEITPVWLPMSLG